MDLNKMVVEALSNMEKEGKVQEIVNKHVESTVESIVKDTFGSWSDFNKDLSKHVKESLQINFRDLDISSYNHLILTAVQDMLNDQVVNEGVKQIKQQLEELLSDTKKEYKLSELVNELKKDVEGADELEYEESIEMTLHVEHSYSSYWIALDTKEDVGEYDCKYRLLVSSEGTLALAKINDKEYGNRNANNFDIKAVMQGLRGFEETLFKIYTSGAKIIVDEDRCDVAVYNPEYAD